MKKWTMIGLTVLLAMSLAVAAFAENTDDETEIGVYAKSEYHTEGAYPAVLEEGGATVILEGNMEVTVFGAPEEATELVIFPVKRSEQEAWDWINACFKGKGTPVHTFDIYFLNASGQRIEANGAEVTIDCPHCTTRPLVCSLSSDGTVQVLNTNGRSLSVTFTTNGSAYYILVEQDSGTEQLSGSGSSLLWIVLGTVTAAGGAMGGFFLIRKKRQQR